MKIKLLVMKTNSNNLRKAQIITDCAMIVLFGAGVIMSFVQGEHGEVYFFLLLVLAWLAILLKDLENARYVKLINLYKEVTEENDKFLDKLLDYINEKQTDNGTDNKR